MSIFIKDMDIPKSCEKCRFCVNGFTDEAPMYECAVQSYENVSVLVESGGKPFDFRPDWCSLIELPPHGRLGDLDELYKVANMADDFGADTTDILKLIIDTPAVIEAEGET